MRTIRSLWLISGELRRTGTAPGDRAFFDARKASWDERTVTLDHDGFPSEAEAQEALLFNWSVHPHEARVSKIEKHDLELPIVVPS